MCYETKKSAQKTTRHILSSETEWLKNKANREKQGIRPHKREKAPEGLLVTRAPWGPHSAWGSDSLENGRGRRDLYTCPEGLGRLVAPG